MVRNAILFWLVILCVVFLGIYFRGSQEKRPVVIHKEWGHCIQPTSDGGYIIAGVIWGRGGGQSAVCLIKTDSHGHEIWSKTFGQGDVSCGNFVQQTIDQGYIIAGTTWPSGKTHSDIYLIKTDSEGNEIWSRSYGGSRRDEGHSVRQTTDGGYVVAGWTASFGQGREDVCLVKTDLKGNVSWRMTYGGSRRDEGYAVSQTIEGGYVIAGQTDSFGDGNDSVYLIKTDADGHCVWSKTFGEKGRAWGKSVHQTDDGGYIVAGTTVHFKATYSDVFLIKTDTDGREIWRKTFGGRYGDYGYSVAPAPDGGYVVAGNTWPFGSIGESKIYLVKTDGNGTKQWEKTIGGEGSEYGFSVCRSLDRGYVIVGKTEYVGDDDDDICLVKLNGDGSQKWHMALKDLGGHP